jgi:hypothetical protein
MFASIALLAAAGSWCPAAAPAPVEVAYDGVLILRVREAAWGLSPARRAVHVTQRFTSLVSDAFEAVSKRRPIPRLIARPMGEDWVVTARGLVLVTVTHDDARANNSDCATLARQWARRSAGALDVATTGTKPSLGQARLLRARLFARALLPLGAMLRRAARGPASEAFLPTPPAQRPARPVQPAASAPRHDPASRLSRR